VVLEEEELTNELLLEEIKKLYKDRKRYIKTMEESPVQNGVDNIIKLIEKYAK
jgi:UDP-N-acetylglucosamine--N-acetylmuramyl-(pentapeptide) pyrophosphoryl-undecaprenol N-acetylglucosamine transferase